MEIHAGRARCGPPRRAWMKRPPPRQAACRRHEGAIAPGAMSATPTAAARASCDRDPDGRDAAERLGGAKRSRAWPRRRRGTPRALLTYVFTEPGRRLTQLRPGGIASSTGSTFTGPCSSQ